MKFGTWSNSKELISILTLFFEIFWPKLHYLIKKYKMLRFTWNLVPNPFRRCWFQNCYRFSKVMDLNYLIWPFLGQKYTILWFTWNLAADLIWRRWLKIWSPFLNFVQRFYVFLIKNHLCFPCCYNLYLEGKKFQKTMSDLKSAPSNLVRYQISSKSANFVFLAQKCPNKVFKSKIFKS